MSIRRILSLLALVGCAVPVTAQEVAVVRAAESSPTLALTNLQPVSFHAGLRDESLYARQPHAAGGFLQTEARPAAQSSSASATAPLLPEVPGLAQVQVTAQHTPFLSESRIPLTAVWSGRVRLSAVQQRFHTASMYSVLSPAYAGEVGTAPGVQSIVAGSRVNYGVGVQFRFGR